jgi:hypothetical protein
MINSEIGRALQDLEAEFFRLLQSGDADGVIELSGRLHAIHLRFRATLEERIAKVKIQKQQLDTLLN